jgi:hypothetical protein
VEDDAITLAESEIPSNKKRGVVTNFIFLDVRPKKFMVTDFNSKIVT